MPPTDAALSGHADVWADRDLLIDAARAAAPLAMAAFRPRGATTAETWEKSDGRGVVTAADLAVNAALREILTAARPDYGWLSEEDADAPERQDRTRVFIVDPIDGTRSFVEGRPEFCISIAVAEAGEAVAGVIYAPALDAMYDAVRTGAARRNGRPIHVSKRAGFDGARVLSSKAHFRPARWSRGAPDVSIGYVQPIAYRLCLVAEGAWDALVSLRGTNEWDVAAGDLIARSAGGRVTEPDGAPFRYNKPTPRVAGTLAAGAALHAAFLARSPQTFDSSSGS